MFTCDICERQFININGLNAHKGVHNAVKNFACELCNKSFTRSKTLNAHRNVHHNDGEKPFNCDVCGKAFISNSDLTKHKRIHTGEKPFKCEVCLKAFSQPGHLTSHMRIHTGERPFKCNECEKTFSASSSLDKHKRSHTGEKPYFCGVCHKSFNSSSWLAKHKRTERHLKKLQFVNNSNSLNFPTSFFNNGNEASYLKQERKKGGIFPGDFLSIQMEDDNNGEETDVVHLQNLEYASSLLPPPANAASISFVDCGGEDAIKQEVQEEEEGFSPENFLSVHMEAENVEETDSNPKNLDNGAIMISNSASNSFDDCSEFDIKNKEIKLENISYGDLQSVQMESESIEDPKRHLKNLDNSANALPTSVSNDCGEAGIKQDIEADNAKEIVKPEIEDKEEI